MTNGTEKVPKRKLSFDEMIQHLEYKNVKFNLISKEDAKEILETSNYFYKITAYRKNFEKNKHDKYVNLDFKLLQDLATIDMRLRYLVLQMCLDIEHKIKTKILADITNDPSEDGYSIVKDYLKKDNSSLNDYMKALNKKSHYNYGLYNKHHNDAPIWVLFEVMTFGALVKFVEYYYKRKKEPRAYKEIQEVLRYAKNIRNTAAHNSPILMDITQMKQIEPTLIIKPITNFAKKLEGLSKSARIKRLTNRKIHDLTALIYIHYTYIDSAGIKNARYKDLQELLERTKKLEGAYDNQDSLIAVYKYFKKIIDYIR
ncbi:Abi family protein [Paenalkalicoccus suaedae]|uniref:Abi family protein n=1 Tax=Paenalkalicoccus suaedae TaxID=2592382 RepID=A0A859FHS4_9BACI|nr:Abi family protein [Paenalkalicoccus suaedae]QKS72677.1 Abi family protein [Paenalkalicoccus suaedae]